MGTITFASVKRKKLNWYVKEPLTNSWIGEKKMFKRTFFNYIRNSIRIQVLLISDKGPVSPYTSKRKVLRRMYLGNRITVKELLWSFPCLRFPDLPVACGVNFLKRGSALLMIEWYQCFWIGIHKVLRFKSRNLNKIMAPGKLILILSDTGSGVGLFQWYTDDKCASNIAV